MKAKWVIGLCTIVVPISCSWPVHDSDREHLKATSQLERPVGVTPTNVLTYWDLSEPDSPTKRLSEFDVPLFASLKHVTLMTGRDGGGTVVFEMDAAIPSPSGGSLVLEAYIEETDGNVTSVAVFAFDSARLDTEPKLLAGEAAIVSLDDGKILSQGAVSIDGKQVKLTFKKGLMNAGTLYMAVARFLPASIPAERVSGGLSACWTSLLTSSDPNPGPQPNIQVPSLPGFPSTD